MSDYHVVPDGDGAWRAVRAGASRAGARAGTQSEAYEAARGFAERSGGGEVRIHRPTGEIRNSNTIGKSDPNPPRDTRH
jgi:hypothetical protein